MAARARRRRSTARRRRGSTLPGWAWMGFGLALGLAVAAAIYVNDRKVPPVPAAPRPAAEPAPQSLAPPPEATARRETAERFDFYEMLPRFEVVLPEQDLRARPDASGAPVGEPGRYVLQAGSFSSFADADRMKAELGLLGIGSQIQRVSIDDRTYHRVRIGPISELAELNAVRTRLRDARVEVMVIRVAD